MAAHRQERIFGVDPSVGKLEGSVEALPVHPFEDAFVPCSIRVREERDAMPDDAFEHAPRRRDLVVDAIRGQLGEVRVVVGVGPDGVAECVEGAYLGGADPVPLPDHHGHEKERCGEPVLLQYGKRGHLGFVAIVEREHDGLRR